MATLNKDKTNKQTQSKINVVCKFYDRSFVVYTFLVQVIDEAQMMATKLEAVAAVP